MLKKLVNTSTIFWLIRQVLQFGGIWLVARGYMTQDELNQTYAILPDLLGGGSFLVGLVLNIASTFRNHVTVGGRKVPINNLPAPSVVEREAEAAIKDKSIFEKIFGTR